MGCRPAKHNHNCHKDCVCRILKKFRSKVVTIKTKTGDVITGELYIVTKDCCVKIIEAETMSPFLPEKLTVIRCKDIENFSVDLLTG